MTPNWKHFQIDTSLDNRITIWIDVAERSVNVLFEAVFDELVSILEHLTQLDSARPLLFRSAKRKGFVVGADLRRILEIESDEESQAFLLHGQRALMRLEEYPCDTIALIQGPCLGGGLELAMACNYRIACDSPETTLGMPESKLGLMPGWGGTQRLIEIAGIANGLQMLVDGESICCDRAFGIHLVDALLDADRYETGATEFIRQLSSRRVAGIDSQREQLKSDLRESFETWRLSHSGLFLSSQAAICKAVETGILVSREAGYRAERELFFPLLCNASVREALQRFAGGLKKSTET